MRLSRLLILITLLLCSCVNPISRAAREQVDPTVTLAMVRADPEAFVARQLLVGGAVVVLERTADGSVLEVMEWRLAPWGEPLGPDDAGRRFLVETPQELDPETYQPGALVTLTGVVRGLESRRSGALEFDCPVLALTELHLWETPFRYGLHSNAAPFYPHYVGHDDDTRRNPYDPDYNPYPYTQYWYRDGNH